MRILLTLVVGAACWWQWQWTGFFSGIILVQFLFIKVGKKSLRNDHFLKEYYEPLFGILGKMTIADGVVDKEELMAIDDFIAKPLQLSYEEQTQAMEWFHEAMEPDAKSIGEYLEEFIENCSSELHLSFVSVLVKLSIVDGKLSDTELEILETCERFLNLPDDTIENLLREHGYPING